MTKSVGDRGSGANDGTRVDSAEWLAGFPFHVGDDVRVPDQPLHVEALRLRPDRVGQVEEVKTAFRLTTVVHFAERRCRRERPAPDRIPSRPPLDRGGPGDGIDAKW